MTPVWLRENCQEDTYVWVYSFFHCEECSLASTLHLHSHLFLSRKTWHNHTPTLLDWTVTNPQAQPKCCFSLLHMPVLTLISLISNYWCVFLPPLHDLKHMKFFSLSQVINKTMINECSSEWLWTELQFEDKNL